MHNISALSHAPLLQMRTGGVTEMIDIHTIIRIEAVSNYSRLHFANGKTLLVCKVLAWFQAALADQGFLRPHRTHLVNRTYISGYVHGKSGRITLCNGEVIDVSKRKKTGFLQYFMAAA